MWQVLILSYVILNISAVTVESTVLAPREVRCEVGGEEGVILTHAHSSFPFSKQIVRQ